MFLWYISVIIYLLLWVVLLIHCIKRRAFYPIFGTGWGTKALWLTTFFLFSPPLTFMYIIFGVLLKPKDYHTKLKLIRPVSVVILILLTLIIVTLEIPAWKQDAKPGIFSKGTEENKSRSFRAEISIGLLKANNNISTSTSSASRDYHPFAGRTILLRTQGSDELLTRVSKNLAKSLSKLPFVEKVEYYPEGTKKPAGLLAPDVYIFLKMPKKKHIFMPFGRKLDAIFTLQALSRPTSSIVHADRMSPRLSFSMKNTLQHRSTLTGYESRKAKYKQQSENIAEQFSESIEKTFKDWIDKYGLLPEMPQICYGKYEIPPQFEFLKDKQSEILISDYGLTLNNYTQWSFVDNRKAQEVLMEIWNSLNDAGWRGRKDSIIEERERFKKLRMEKGPEQICIARKKKINPATGNRVLIHEDMPPVNLDMPFIVHYEKQLDNNQVAELRHYLIGSNTDVQTLLMFYRRFRTENKDAFIRKLEQLKGQSFGAHFELAKYYQQQNEIEKAKDALQYARALTYTVRENNHKSQEIKKLAQKLGDKKLADKPIDPELFKKIGFIDANTLDQPYEVEKQLTEPLLLYYVKKDGTIRTCTLHVHKDAPGKYTVHKVIKEKSSTIWSSREISTVKHNGRKAIEVYIGRNCLLENSGVTVNITVTNEEKVIFKAKKH